MRISLKFVILIIDIGNTYVKMVRYDGGIMEEHRVALSAEDEILSYCQDAFSGGIYCSVVDLPMRLEKAFAHLSYPMLRYQSGVTPVPLTSRYQTPLTLGADRMAAAVGAWSRWPDRNVLIVDIGTCVTFDFVSGQGEYLGGNISPGPLLRLKALHQFTGKLPLVEAWGPRPAFGDTTETAIRCGVMDGLRFEIEGYVRHYRKKFPNLMVCLTGGVNMDLSLDKGVEVVKDSLLVPEGLYRILKYNEELAAQKGRERE
jgi:type III pantothenate kinase